MCLKVGLGGLIYPSKMVLGMLPRPLYPVGTNLLLLTRDSVLVCGFELFFMHHFEVFKAELVQGRVPRPSFGQDCRSSFDVTSDDVEEGVLLPILHWMEDEFI